MGKKSSIGFVPGWGTSASAWEPVITRLFLRHDVQTFDWPWCDQKSIQSMQDFDEYTAILAAKLPNSSELVGWSLGGLLSLNIAISYPQKVTKLVLVASAPRMVSIAGWPYGIDASQYSDFSERFDRAPEKTWKRFLALVAAGDENPSVTRAQLQEGNPYNDAKQSEYRYGLECMQALDLRPQLDALNCEIALIHGANDQLLPCQASMETQKMIPKASLHIVENTGHAPHIGQPERFTQVVSKCLSP